MILLTITKVVLFTMYISVPKQYFVCVIRCLHNIFLRIPPKNKLYGLLGYYKNKYCYKK